MNTPETAEQKKITPNDTIIGLINFANAGKMGEFYKVAERYRDSLAKTGDFHYRIRNLINSRPREMHLLNDLAREVKGLVDIGVVKEGENVFLNDDLNEKITELITEWKNSELYSYHNIGVRRKILLHGPTGNGKTTIAREISRRSGLPLLEIDTDSVIDSHIGNTGSNISNLLTKVKEPCILFWDEIDSIGMKRLANASSGADAENIRMINSMLVNMDKLSADVVLIGATNRMDAIDSAFLRRFDDIVEVGEPSETEKLKYMFSLRSYYKIGVDLMAGEFDLSKYKNYSEIKNDFIKMGRRYIINKINQGENLERSVATDAK